MGELTVEILEKRYGHGSEEYEGLPFKKSLDELDVGEKQTRIPDRDYKSMAQIIIEDWTDKPLAFEDFELICECHYRSRNSVYRKIQKHFIGRGYTLTKVPLDRCYMLRKLDKSVDRRTLKGGIYAVYKGEQFLAEGTVEELAVEFGVTEKTVRWWASPANDKRGKKRKVAVKVSTLEKEQHRL